MVTDCGCHVPPWASYTLVSYGIFSFSKLHFLCSVKTCVVVVIMVKHELIIKIVRHRKYLTGGDDYYLPHYLIGLVIITTTTTVIITIITITTNIIIYLQNTTKPCPGQMDPVSLNLTLPLAATLVAF